MTDEQQKSKSASFYEDRGLIRHMVIISPEHREKLKAEAKKVGLIQGEVIEVLLDCVDFDSLADKFKAKKVGKTEGKLTKADLLKKMKDLTPEQLAAINEIVEKK